MPEYISIRMNDTGNVISREKKNIIETYERQVRSRGKAEFTILDAPKQIVIPAKKNLVAEVSEKSETADVGNLIKKSEITIIKKAGRPKK